MKLKDKVAIITGGGTGIGRAIAELFATEGASVVITGRRPEMINEVQGGITASGGKCLAIPADISNDKDHEKLIEQTLKAFGKLHILVNNAGVLTVGSVTETDAEMADQVFAINVRGVFHLCRLALPEIERSGGGSIINISSTLGEKVVPAFTVYSASKAALNMMSKSMALDYASKGIRVNIISPGVVDTPIHAARKIDDMEAWEKQFAAMHPLGRIGKPIDIAKAALFLASDDASWITGANLHVDGGINLT
ncbi:MAG TPA: SDR family oxidoreductase [Blastocatellia bacterium]|nr:SDR family oxidoreductase [Blastocatellia bacterium]